MRGGATVIALTGQSGCGKSTVADYFRAQGCTVLDCDKTAAAVLAEDPDCLRQLTACFGTSILDENGRLLRRRLANLAFSTPQGREQLNRITHPLIIRRLLSEIDAAARRGEKLVFADGAVIVGEAFQEYCDKILVVDAPHAAQLVRLRARDGITAEEAERRLRAQQTKQQLAAAADEVIFNGGDREQLIFSAAQTLRRLRLSCGALRK